jgi:HAD superfamily hydrolase (TIGR01509 family)
MTGPIEAVLFDFGGTLDSDGVAWKERFYAQYRAEGLEMGPAAFESAFFAADDPLVGSLPLETDLSGTVRQLTANLEAELARCRAGVAQDGASGRGQRVASHFLSEASAAIARNRPVLEALSGRYRLGIVSNFYGNLDAVCRGAGLASLFGVIVDSHRVGAEKPDPAIFRAALEPLRATPTTTLFVGDSLRRDREGARRIGMGFIWIASREARTSGAYPSGQPLDHPVVSRLGELAQLLL